MPLVKLYHPALGDAQRIDVDALSVPHYRRSGWLPVGEKPAQPEESPATSRRKSEVTK